MQHHGFIGPRGSLALAVTRAPRVGWGYRLRNLPNIWRGWWKHQLAVLFGISHLYGELYVRVNRCQCGAPHTHGGKVCPVGQWIDYGRVSTRVVTTAGANFLVDALQGTVEPEILRYHALGTGTNAEAVGDTALQTELSTAYNPDSTRATGSLTEGASANIFRSVGTNTLDGSAAVTEHAIVSQAATGGGTVLDRSVFSVINLSSGDSLQSTYDFTINTGG